MTQSFEGKTCITLTRLQRWNDTPRQTTSKWPALSLQESACNNFFGMRDWSKHREMPPVRDINRKRNLHIKFGVTYDRNKRKIITFKTMRRCVLLPLWPIYSDSISKTMPIYVRRVQRKLSNRKIRNNLLLLIKKIYSNVLM